MKNIKFLLVVILILTFVFIACVNTDVFDPPPTTEPNPDPNPNPDPKPDPEPDPVINPLDINFDINTLGRIELTVPVGEWNLLLEYYHLNRKNKERVRASRFVYTDGKGSSVVDYPNISFRIRGNTSRREPEVTSDRKHNSLNPQWQSAHFKMDFRRNFNGINVNYSNRRFLNYRAVNLKWFKDDATFCREPFSYDLFNRFDIWTASRVKYVKLIIKITEDDDESVLISQADFGLYMMFEDFDRELLTHRLKSLIDPDGSKGIGFSSDRGDLWKCRYINGPANLENVGNLDNMIGVEDITLQYTREYTYDLSTNESHLDSQASARQQFKQFIYNLNTKTGDDFKTWISALMDIDLFLKTIAVETALGHWDNYWGNHNNYYLYFDGHFSAINRDYNSSKLYFIPYDLDNTLGSGSRNVNNIDAGTQNPLFWGGHRDTNRNPLITKVLAIPEYEEKYKEYLKMLADPENDLIHPVRSIPRIQTWHNMLEGNFGNDIVRNIGSQTFKQVVDMPAYWSADQKYRLLTGDDNTNFFRAKVKSIEQYCN